MVASTYSVAAKGLLGRGESGRDACRDQESRDARRPQGGNAGSDP
jgi:hypothetical protein